MGPFANLMSTDAIIDRKRLKVDKINTNIIIYSRKRSFMVCTVMLSIYHYFESDFYGIIAG